MPPKKKGNANPKKAVKPPPQRRPGAPDGVEGFERIPHKWQRRGGEQEVVTLDHLASELGDAIVKDRKHGPQNWMNYLSDKRFLKMVKASELHSNKDEWSRPFAKKLSDLLNDVSLATDPALQMSMLDQVFTWFQRHEHALDPSPPRRQKAPGRIEFWNFCQKQTLPGSTSYHFVAPQRNFINLPDKEDQMSCSLSPPLTPTTAAPYSRPLSATSSYYRRPTSATSSYIPFSCPASRPQSATLPLGFTSRPMSARRSRPTSAQQTKRPTSAQLSRPSSAQQSRPSSAHKSRPTSAQRMNRPTSAGFSRLTNAGLSRPESAGLSRPDSAGLGRPDSVGFSRPDSARLSRPDSAGFGCPDSARLSRSDSPGFSRPNNTRPTSAQTLSEQMSRPTSAQQRPSELNVPSSCPADCSLPRPPVAQPFNPRSKLDGRVRKLPSCTFTTLSGFHGAMRPEKDIDRRAVQNMDDRWVACRNTNLVNKRFDEEVQEALFEWSACSARLEENQHQRFHSSSIGATNNEILDQSAVPEPVKIRVMAKPTVRRQCVVLQSKITSLEGIKSDYNKDLHLKKLAHLRRHHHKVLHQPPEDMPITTLVEDDSFVDLQQVCDLWREKHPVSYGGMRSGYFEQQRMKQLKEVEKIKLLNVPVSDKVLREALVTPAKSIKMDAVPPGPHIPRLLLNPKMGNALAKLMKKKKKKGARTRRKKINIVNM